MAECCRVCGSSTKTLFSGIVLGYEVAYFECSRCDYVQTQNPEWLVEAYKQSINSSDTGILWRNEWMRRVTATLIYCEFDCNGLFLDAAGGYGLFVRMMRDIGFDFQWEDHYSQNLLASGFERKEQEIEYSMITCFEAFEHFVHPMDEFDRLLSFSNNIFFSTELIPKPAPKPETWWYYGLDHGQHIGFFRRKTLERMLSMYGLNLCSNGTNLHLITENTISDLRFRFWLKASRVLQPWIRAKMNSRVWSDRELLTCNQV